MSPDTDFKKTAWQVVLCGMVFFMFPAAGVPTDSEWKDALSWLKEKGILTTDVSYQDSVNASLLP